jgi:hypothetical protein
VNLTVRPRVGRQSAGRPKTLAASLALLALSVAATAHGTSWPSERYRNDPHAFCTEVLGFTPWAKQVEILEAVRDCPRVSVASGHKIGKSRVAAAAALHFYCSWDAARVVLTSVTARQVQEILWREISMLVRGAKVPVGGELAKLAHSGLKAEDFRQIVGFTAKDPEAVAGISGPNVLYICDEASGIPEEIFEAIEGNRAGGAKILLISNPTKNEGTFFASHHDHREFWRTIRISSEDTPNVVEGRAVLPGLATREWVEEKRAEWGEDSALYQVRVRGEFPREEARKVVQLHLISEAEERWEDAAADGRLHIGVDSKGSGDDELGLAARRGQKMLDVKGSRATDENEQIAEAVQFIRQHRRAHEGPPAVKVDATGATGAFATKLRAALVGEADVISVDFSTRCIDRAYPTMRDALWFGARTWLRGGGALPPERTADGRVCRAHDKKLSAELTAPGFDITHENKQKVEPKEALRKRLKRSTDRGDAVLLAIFEPASSRWEETTDRGYANDFYEAASSDACDPYSALAATHGLRGGRG